MRESSENYQVKEDKILILFGSLLSLNKDRFKQKMRPFGNFYFILKKDKKSHKTSILSWKEWKAALLLIQLQIGLKF